MRISIRSAPVAGVSKATNPRRPRCSIGSHIDTVVDAGRYDGTLGVVLGISSSRRCAATHHASCPIEIVAFGDKENARFPTNLSTSQAFSGRYDPAWLDGKDQDGVTLREALAAFGGDPARIDAIKRDRARYRGYLEVQYPAGAATEATRTRSASCRPCGISRARMAVTGRQAMPAPYR